MSTLDAAFRVATVAAMDFWGYFAYLSGYLLDILGRSRGDVDTWYIGDRIIRCDYAHAQAANFLETMLHELRGR